MRLPVRSSMRSSCGYPRPSEVEITPKSLFLSRRQVMRGALASACFGVMAGRASADTEGYDVMVGQGHRLLAHKGPYSLPDSVHMTSQEDVTHYNNFYEFGMGKTDPAENSGHYQPLPWTLEVTGLVKNPLKLDIAALQRHPELEERIYRMRCVEAWSMVIPWAGLPLHKILNQAEPAPEARFVAFESIVRPSEMPGQRDDLSGITWPYVEGLRLDEAMNPLTLLALGVYGEALPNANGAPVRLVVPWKYGFKGIKAIRCIRLVREQPPCTWNQLAPQEYGFYANVNPDIDHPRWSQAQERVIGRHSLFGEQRQPTLLFNGYAEQVASLYKGMDLRANF